MAEPRQLIMIVVVIYLTVFSAIVGSRLRDLTDRVTNMEIGFCFVSAWQYPDKQPEVLSSCLKQLKHEALR